MRGWKRSGVTWCSHWRICKGGLQTQCRICSSMGFACCLRYDCMFGSVVSNVCVCACEVVILSDAAKSH